MDLPESLEPFRARIQLQSLPCVRFTLVESDWPGRSRVGGVPLLVDPNQWPKNPDGRSMEFVLQIDLAEASAHGFPQSGLLQFFFDVEKFPWGEPGDEDFYRVLYHPEGAHLAETDSQADALEPRGLAFAPAVSLPPVEMLGLPEELEDEYTDLAWMGETVHQLGGYPMEIQNPVHDYLDHLPEKERYRLLLQVDSEEEIGMWWGDSGRVYLMIHEQDLSDGRFDRVALNLQCC